MNLYAYEMNLLFCVILKIQKSRNHMSQGKTTRSPRFDHIIKNIIFNKMVKIKS